MSWLRPARLEGRHVHLVPLGVEHLDAVWAAGDDPGIWRWMPYRLASRDDVASYVDRLLAWPGRGFGQAFVQLDTERGEICGVTCYLNADEAHRRVEIGGTWITPASQRTAVNTEAKLLLLRHAFDVLDAVRVEWKTDSENVRSRAAIARLGAVEEGTLRNHMIRPDGTMRHSTYYSVTREEWPAVERRLEGLVHGRARG